MEKNNKKNSPKGRYKTHNNSYNGASGILPGALFDNLIWLTTDEAAHFLRKSPHALRQMTYKGQIQARKFGGRLYFKRAELNELIDTSFY